MDQEKTYNNCQFFDTDVSCPNGKDEFMKQFRDDVSIGQSNYRKTINIDKEAEINKRFCRNCDSFRALKKS